MSNSDAAYKLQEEGTAAPRPASANMKRSDSQSYSPTGTFCGFNSAATDFCGGYAVEEWERDNTGSKYYMPRKEKNATMKPDGDGIEQQWSEHDKIVIQRLSMRKYHSPGNNYCEDLCQFY